MLHLTPIPIPSSAQEMAYLKATLRKWSSRSCFVVVVFSFFFFGDFKVYFILRVKKENYDSVD